MTTQRRADVNDLAADAELNRAMAAYDATHRGWDRLLADVTPVEDGAHGVSDLSEHDSNGEA